MFVVFKTGELQIYGVLSRSLLCLSFLRVLFVCKMQIRVKTATRFLYFGPVAIAKQANITAIPTTKLITHIEKEIHIWTSSGSCAVGQSLSVFILTFALAFANHWPVKWNIVSPKKRTIERKI